VITHLHLVMHLIYFTTVYIHLLCITVPFSFEVGFHDVKVHALTLSSSDGLRRFIDDDWVILTISSQEKVIKRAT
jgi:hypothetical protein